VLAQQTWSEHLLGLEQVPQVSPRVGAAHGTHAVGVERSFVFRVARLLDVDAPVPGERLAIATVARGQHAIEHVDAAPDGLEQIVGRPHAHQVARAVRGHLGREFAQYAHHLLDWLAHREAPERHAVHRQTRDVLQVT